MRNGTEGDAIEEELRRIRQRVELQIKVIPRVDTGKEHVGSNVVADTAARERAAAIPTGEIVPTAIVERDIPEKIPRASPLSNLKRRGDEAVGVGTIQGMRHAHLPAPAQDLQRGV